MTCRPLQEIWDGQAAPSHSAPHMLCSPYCGLDLRRARREWKGSEGLC